MSHQAVPRAQLDRLKGSRSSGVGDGDGEGDGEGLVEGVGEGEGPPSAVISILTVCSFFVISWWPPALIHPCAVTCISTEPLGTFETLATP